MTDRPAPHDGVPAGVRDELVRLLAGELSDIWSAAVDAGGSARQLVEIVDRRRRLLAATRPCDPREVRR
jgi:hypothetical protein